MSQGFEEQSDNARATGLFCANCGVDIACGAEEETSDCWCKRFPRLPQVAEIDGEQCLCPSCLGVVLKHAIARGVEEKGVNAMVTLASQNATNAFGNARRSKPKLIEHVDFQIENGKYVFSSWYHLKRGYCCGSGCRNWPFD